MYQCLTVHNGGSFFLISLSRHTGKRETQAGQQHLIVILHNDKSASIQVQTVGDPDPSAASNHHPPNPSAASQHLLAYLQQARQDAS